MPASTLLRSLSAVTSVIVLLFAASISAADVDKYLEEARQFIADGKTKSAVIQLKNALQSDPANLEARLMLAALYLRNGDGASAAKEYRRARDLDAANAEWLPGYARALMLQGAFRELLTEVEADEALPPEARAELLALRGGANLALRQIDAAVIEFDAALALDSGNPAARLGKAQILLQNGEDQQALEQLDKILLDHPGHVQSRLARGDLLRRLKRMEEAEADYARVLEEGPGNPRAYMGLALIHLSQRDTAAARQDLAALNRLAPNLPAGTYLQALLSFQEKDYDRASDELQRLLGVAPGNLQAQLLYGIVSYVRGEFTVADDYLTRVSASLPGNLQLAKLLGASRLKLRQPDRAVAVLSSVVDENTQDVQLLALMGTAYLQAGDNSKGAEYIQRAVELDPDQALLRTQLAVGRLVTGDTTAAISELESAVALGQDVLQADVLLVLSYLNKQEFEKAIAASQALQKRMSDSPIPYNLLGLAYLSERKLDLAREHFNLALEKDPEFLVARMNLARLAVVEQQLGEAAAAYEAVLRQDPKHLQAMMGLAALAKAQNDGAGAERWLLRANQTNPKALQPILVLAETYLRQNEGLKANNLFTGLDPQQAEQPAVLRLKGMAQLQNGDSANAIYTLKKLTELQPAAMEGWFQLARAQAAAGDAASARVSFERATALDAEHKVPVVWVGLGELELREKRYDAALEVAQTIRAHFPDNVFGYDIEAAAYRGKGQIAQALAASEAALRIDRSSRRVNAQASALAAAGQPQQGIAMLRDWLEQHAQDGAGWANLGMLNQQSGKDEEALQAYERSLTYTDPNPVILNNLAWLYLDRDPERALELATQAYELAPARAEIVDTYGWVLFQQGRKSDGLAALQQALIIAPRNADIGLHVAQALHAMNRDSEARPILERIARENPGSAAAEAARDLLDSLSG